MATINKLLIQGIRSFSQQDEAVIEFFCPLTLIVGPNGAGKTTIIECLRYATTGDMPPNAKGAGFILDPKIADVTEVKARVKFQFTGVDGQRYVCMRALQATQKAKKLESRTLDNSLLIVNQRTGEQTRMSSKCADIDRMMQVSLGVSRAILENVIFCHQEDSSWPLSEPSVLKKKFDDIFGSTRYMKALDSIKQSRKEMTDELKVLDITVKELDQRKKAAQQKRSDLRRLQAKMRELESDMQEFEQLIAPIEAEMDQIKGEDADIRRLETENAKAKETCKMLALAYNEMKARLEITYKESDEDLAQKLAAFTREVEKAQGTLQEKKRRLAAIAVEVRSQDEKRSNLINEQARLSAEAGLNAQRIKDRQRIAGELKGRYQIELVLSDPMTDVEAKAFVEKFVEKQTIHKNGVTQRRREFSEKEEALQKEIGDLRTAITVARTTAQSIRDDLNTMNRRRNDLVGQLEAMQATEARVSETEVEYSRSEKRLTDVRQKANLSALEADIKKCEIAAKEASERCNELSEEMKRMNLQNELRTRQEQRRRDRDAKEASRRSLLESKRSQLEAVFESRVPAAEVLASSLRTLIRDKQRSLSQQEQKVQSSRGAVDSCRTEKRLTEEALARLEVELRTVQAQIASACGGKTYETALAEVLAAREEAQKSFHLSESADTMYKSFIARAQADHFCPLCSRHFDEANAFQNFMGELNEMLNRIPLLRQERKVALEEEERRYRELISLETVRVRVAKLESEAGDLRRKIADQTRVLQAASTELDEAALLHATQQSELESAQKLVSDVDALAVLATDIARLGQEIDAEESRIIGGSSTRTFSDVAAEFEASQQRADAERSRADKLRKESQQRQTEITVIESDLLHLRTQRDRLVAELERRRQLAREKDELSERIKTKETEMRELEGSIEPRNTKLMERETTRDRLRNQVKLFEEETKNEMERFAADLRPLRELSRQIDDYTMKGNENDLKTIATHIAAAEARRTELQAEKEKLDGEVRETEALGAKQNHTKRCMEANIELRRKAKDLAAAETTAQQLSAQLAEKDGAELHRQHEALNKRLVELRSERAKKQGAVEQMRSQIRSLEVELSNTMYRNVDNEHKKSMIKLKTTQLASKDLEKYYGALDKAVMRFHTLKMEEINKIIQELWSRTYRNSDIDTIKICSDIDEEEKETDRKAYKYRVVMEKGGVPVDMRGRCSAGQRVLASLIIRLALSETFCINCGILALDEPTTNLDKDNIESLANALADIIRSRRQQSNFQLVVITHDEEFVNHLGRSVDADNFYRVSKNHGQFSTIARHSFHDTNYNGNFP